MKTKKSIEKLTKNSNFNWLGRNSFIKEFSDYLLSQEESMHVCINGVWGSGKTTTVLGIIDYLSSKESEKPLILYLDAWKYEHYGHPLFSLLKVMEEESPEIYEIIKSNLNDISIETNLALSFSLFSISASAKNDGPTNQVLALAEYTDALNKLMVEAVKCYKAEKNNKLVIFIDELDRAKPEFALKTIEMFHHLQDDLPTHIVYAVDINQLNSIIKHYYGYDYNVEIFVHKVFDVIIPLMKLSEIEVKRYISNIFEEAQCAFNIDYLVNIILSYFRSEQIDSLRTINKVCEKVILNLNQGYFKTANDQFRRSDYYLGRDYLWGYVELLIAIEILYLTNPLEVNNFLKGNNFEVLFDYLLNHKNENNEMMLWVLVNASFNYGNDEKAEQINSENMERNEFILGLKRLFIPPKTKYYYKSVFNSVEF